MTETTQSAPAVYAAIAKVMKEMARDGIAKNRTTTGGGTYKFRGIDDVYNALSGPLAANDLVMLPRVISRTCTERQTSAGKPIFYSFVEVEFDLVSAIDGSKHTIRTVGEAMDSSDKSSNKAMSAAFKYAAMQAFCIPTEGDNDADATTHEVVTHVLADAQAKADEGKEAFTELWKSLTAANRAALKPYMTDLQARCLAADQAQGVAQ